VGRSGSQDKPFKISKQLVWEAYERVKQNKGAAGVDGNGASLIDHLLSRDRLRVSGRRG